MSSLVILGGSWTDEPGLDTAISKLILDRVSDGDMPATMRIYTPGREVAFGKRDTVTKQYPAAVRAAHEAGFSAVERLAGGRAAVFHEQTIAFSIAIPDDDPRTAIRERFTEMSNLIVDSFWRLGIETQVGEVQGEYCPGEYSINHAGRIKVMGVGQRLARRATHVGGVIAVANTDLLLRALIPVYRALEIEWRPSTTGTLADVSPSVTNDLVIAALKAELAEHYELSRDRIGGDLVEAARDLVDHYLPDLGATD